MIRFKEDWAKYPNAIVHSSTKNRSWVRMAHMYKEGFKVENYCWHLALMDPTLEHVDPLDPELSSRDRLKVIRECYVNPWYFYREVLRIPSKGGGEPGYFRCDRGTLATIWCYHNHIDTTNVQLRQTGKTIKIEAIAIYLLAIGTKGATTLYGTTDNAKRTDAINSIKDKLELLPDFLYSPIKGKDYDNKIAISNVKRKNYIEFVIGQKDPVSAEKKGRGFSLATQIWDEVAETSNVHIAIGAASLAGSAAIKNAKAAGRPYGKIFACTAGSLDRPEGAYYYALSTGGMGWTELLFDCTTEEDLFETVSANCREKKAPSVDITMSWRQLGLSLEDFEEILARTRKDTNNDQDRIDRECYSIWKHGSISNPLDKSQIQTVFDSQMEAVKIEKSPEKVLMYWYRPMDEVHALAKAGLVSIGIDSSNGVDKDYCSITVTNLANLEVLGRADINRINLQTYANYVTRLLLSLPNSVMVIENKSSGQYIIDVVTLALHAAKEDPFKRIYNNITQDPVRYKRQYAEINETPLHRRSPEFYEAYKGLFGFSTNAALRQKLYDEVLRESVKMGGSFVRDRTLGGQLRVLEKRNGRVDHPKGGNDDAVISWLLSNWFAIFGRNLKHYAIDGSMVLKEAISTEDGKFSQEELDKQKEVRMLNMLVGKLEEEYKLNIDSMYGFSIKDKLVKAYTRLEQLGGLAKNIDQLLEELKVSVGVERKKKKFIFRAASPGNELIHRRSKLPRVA